MRWLLIKKKCVSVVCMCGCVCMESLDVCVVCCLAMCAWMCVCVFPSQLYILTLMSLAAQLYRHPSLRSPVTLVVVQVLLVEDSEVGPQLSSIAGVALRNFCSWQQLFNPPSQRHPQHYDTAVQIGRAHV